MAISIGAAPLHLHTLKDLETLAANARSIGLGDDARLEFEIDPGFPGSRDPREQSGPTLRMLTVTGEFNA